MNWLKKAKWEDKLKGGEGDDKTPDDFDKDQVEKGKNVEFEHTNDPDIATEIALDHLTEHKDYYIALEQMEKMLEGIEEKREEKEE